MSFGRRREQDGRYGPLMGVTIHFEGRLRGEASLAAALALAREFSDDHQWSCQSIDEPEVTLMRVSDEERREYVGPIKGLVIQPHENSEPFRLEFDRDLYVQNFCKTQFAPIEVHVQLVELLNLLKPLFENLDVFDEGEYFETGDLDSLTRHRNRCSEVIDDLLAQSDKNTGPIRLDSGRIVDLTTRE